MKRDFVKNIGIVSAGPIIAVVAAFIAEPWIARLWSPAVYGVGSYYFNIVSLLSGLLFFRYNYAIVQAKDSRESHNLLVLCILILFLVTIIAFPFYGMITKNLETDFPFHEFKHILCFSIIVDSLSTLLKYWHSGKKQFIVLTQSSVSASLFYIAMKLVFAYFGRADEKSIILIRTLSFVLAFLILLWPYVKHDLKNTFESVSFKGIVRVARNYSQYPRYEYLGFLVNTLSVSLPVILITRYWGPESNGHYVKAYNLIYVFIIFLGDAVNRVLHKETADMVNRGESIGSFLNQTTEYLSRLALLPSVAIILFGPELFSVFLGANWVISGEIARYIAIWALSGIVCTSIVPVYAVLNKQKQYTVFTIVLMFLRALVLIVFGLLEFSITFTIAVFSLVNFAVLFFQSHYILRKAGVNLQDLGKSILSRLIQLIPYILAVIAVKTLFDLSKIYTLVIGTLLAAPYVYMFYIHKSPILSMMRRTRSS